MAFFLLIISLISQQIENKLMCNSLKLFGLVFWVQSLFVVQGQSNDSIDVELNKLRGDEYNEALQRIGFDIVAEDPDRSIELADKLMAAGSNERYQGLGYYIIGEACFYKELYKEALKNYKEAIPFLLSEKDSTKVSGIYSNIGLLYYYAANYDGALDYYGKSLEIDKLLMDSLGMAKSLQNMGLIFGECNKVDLHIDYLNQAKSIYENLDDKESVADLAFNLGVAYARNEEYKNAEDYYFSALKEYRALSDSSKIASVLNNIGCLLFRKNDYINANLYFSESEKIFSGIGDKAGLVHVYSGLGDVLAATDQKKKAILMYKKSEEINKEVGLLSVQKDNLYSLYKAYKSIGEYKNALPVLEDYYLLKDSIYNEAQLSKVLELEEKYLYQKSKNHVAELIARNRLYLILFVVVVFVVVLMLIYGVYYYRTKRLNEKQRLLKLEQKVLRTQMNPHFIFNSLSAIQSYILESKTFDAVDFLADFAGLMRLVLQCSQDEYITLKQEYEILEYYLNLQNRRFGDKINCQIIVDDNLDLSNVMIPPMLAQPFIENSFEHGELYKRENGSIVVRFEKKAKKLSYRIDDNGVGINNKNNSSDMDKKHKSLALKITRERLRLINHSYNTQRKVGLIVEDKSKYGEDGTRVEFSIPLVTLN